MSKTVRMKPDGALWMKINLVLYQENAGVVLVTLLAGMCAILVDARVVDNEQAARVHLAAMLLSPDDGPPGALLPLLGPELERLGMVRA